MIRFLGFLALKFVFFFFLTISYPLAPGFPGSSDGKASAYNVEDPGLIPGLGRSRGEGNGNPF